MLELTITTEKSGFRKKKKRRKKRKKKENKYLWTTRMRGSLETFTLTIELDASSMYKKTSLTNLKLSARIVKELPGSG